MSNFITTYSNIKFNPIEPEVKDISIKDIAHSLSLMTRANGHFKEFYSVAQHSIYCANEAITRGYSSKVALACLIHDASEAYLADITRPVKKNLFKYLEIEENLQTLIYDKFIQEQLTEDELELVHSIDNSMLYYEFIHYKDLELDIVAQKLKSNPEFKFIDFKIIENEFINLFNELNS